MAIFSAIASAIAWVGGFLAAAAGIPFATAVTIGTYAGQIGGALVALAVSRALSPKVSIPRADIQAILSQSDAPRRIYVGQYLAGGIRAIFDVRSNILYQLVMVSHGHVSEFVEFWIDGEPVTAWEDDFVRSGRASGVVQVNYRLGNFMGGDYGAAIPFGYWGPDRRLEGQATFLVRSYAPSAEFFAKVFPKSYNTTYQWVIRGQRVFDPRTGATEYSDNAALVIAHYLRHEDGARMSQADVNWESVAAMADVADRQVPLSNGSTQRALRLWGYWTLDEPPADVLGRMQTNSGIRAYEMQDGRIGLVGGPYGEPSCTLTAKDISSIQSTDMTSEREGYNVLRVFHLSSSQKYELIEVDPWRDEARLSVEGEIVKEMRLEMCQSLSQARRLSKERIFDDNRPKLEIITNLVGLKARFPRRHGQRHTIMLDYVAEDGSGRVIRGEYEVMDHEFDPKELQCRISLERVNRISQEWDADDEGETVAELPDPEGNPPPDISATLTQRVVQVTGGQLQATLEVSAVPIPDRPDIELRARYRSVGASAWIDMQSSEYSADSGVVEDGVSYEAQARFVGVFDGVDEWEDLGPITIQINSTPPGQPSELILGPGSGYVLVNWRNPNTAFYQIRIYRNTTSDFGSAALVAATGGAAGQISEYQDDTVSASTTYYYWVAAANSSGVEGPPAGPATITT